MHSLLFDRYLRCGNDVVCDLVTGNELPVDEVDAPDASAVSPGLASFFELLDHGREGEPHWVRLSGEVCHGGVVTELACGAQLRGYVPVSVHVYQRARCAVPEELRDRAVVLIDHDGGGPEALACLMAAASWSSRPHVLVTLGSAPRPAVAREARPRFGEALTAPRLDVERLKARSGLAAGHVRDGRHAAAVRLLREIAAALERRGAFAEAADVVLSLGYTLFERGRLSEVLRACVWGSGLAERAACVSTTCAVRLLEAWARLEQLDGAEAESLTRATLACAPDANLQARARVTLARCLADQARWREIPAIESDIGVAAGPDIDPYWRALTHDVAATVLIETGRLAEAGRLVRAALDAFDDSAHPLAAAILHTAHLRVVMTTGDTTLAAAVLKRATELARTARSPMRAIKARAIWCAGLARAGLMHQAAAEHQRLIRLLRCSPTSLVREAEAALRAPRGLRDEGSRQADARLAVQMLERAQEEDDAEAVRAVLELARRELDAARVDVVSAAAGPATVIVSVGAGRPTTIGARVLDSGLAIGCDSGGEAGVPVRLGARQVAALVARWPPGREFHSGREATLRCAAAVAAARIEGLQERAREAAAASVEIPELIGVGAASAELRRAVLRAARAPFAVLVEGESGVGKELVARAIHHLSQRRERRFCDVNCAALPDELFETELFGHTRGAFSGAVADRAGLFEEATGGTLFLDEVADLSLRAQAKLLRAVQQQEVRRIGESFSRQVDVRLVSAANRRIPEEVEAGRFRADLLYRLDVIHIRIAPLRERPEDIPVLAEHLWRQAAARVGSGAVLSPGALAAMSHYAWPGNVRELQNVVARLVVAAPSRGRVRADLLPPVISEATSVSTGRLGPARDQFERRFIELALARAGGNRSRAAQALGVSRQGLLKSMVRLGLRHTT